MPVQCDTGADRAHNCWAKMRVVPQPEVIIINGKYYEHKSLQIWRFAKEQN